MKQQNKTLQIDINNIIKIIKKFHKYNTEIVKIITIVIL